jgi:hypothetical protein
MMILTHCHNDGEIHRDIQDEHGHCSVLRSYSWARRVYPGHTSIKEATNIAECPGKKCETELSAARGTCIRGSCPGRDGSLSSP